MKTDLTEYHRGRADAFAAALTIVEEWVRNTNPRYHADLIAALAALKKGAAYASLNPAHPAPPRRAKGAE